MGDTKKYLWVHHKTFTDCVLDNDTKFSSNDALFWGTGQELKDLCADLREWIKFTPIKEQGPTRASQKKEPQDGK